MSDKKRFPTLCSWCANSFVGKDQTNHYTKGTYNHEYSTVCICGHFELDGKDNYPDKTECSDYEQDPTATLVDIEWYKIAWAAKEIDRMETKKIIMENYSDESKPHLQTT